MIDPKSLRLYCRYNPYAECFTTYIKFNGRETAVYIEYKKSQDLKYVKGASCYMCKAINYKYVNNFAKRLQYVMWEALWAECGYSLA